MLRRSEIFCLRFIQRPPLEGCRRAVAKLKSIRICFPQEKVGKSQGGRVQMNPKPCGQHVNEMSADAISDENVPRTDIASLDSNVYTLS